MSTDLGLTLRGLTLRSVVVPLSRPLATRVIVVREAALLLIDLHTEEGVTGRAYLFGFSERGNAHLASVLRGLGENLRGERIAPAELHAKATRSLTLLGHQGITAQAISGLDMACWDALARAAGVPLVTLLGGGVQPVAAYNSNGLGLVGPEAAAEEAPLLVAEGGYAMIKMRVGRETLEEDIAAVRAVRAAIGEEVLLPCDFNQSLTVMEAVRRGRALDAEGLYWIEEPIVYDDLAGNAKVAREVATPVQIGENLYGPRAVADAVAAGACDYLMLDLARIGGVTGWQRAAAIAEAAGLQVSSHIYPEFSCHLLPVTPTRHWLEYMDWASAVLAEPMRVEGGHALPRGPGAGLEWNEDAVEKFAADL